MEINQQNLSALSHYLSETTAPDAQRRKAGTQPGFCLLVLHLLQVNEIDMSIRQAGAVFFKNFIKQKWSDREANAINAQDRIQIKSVIVNLMLSVPSLLYKQLAASLEIISTSDFPKDWTNLLPELIAKLQSSEPHVVTGSLRTLNAIFKRYRHLSKAPGVLEELQYILKLFQEPLLKLFQATMAQVEALRSNPAQLVVPLGAIKLMLHLFYSLNAIDLPEYFEDHLSEWMTPFQALLRWESSQVELVGEEDDEEPGILHSVQALVCRNLNLYIGKYEEEFAPFYESFLRDVWALLGRLSNAPKYDKLVTGAIQFLSTAATSVHHGVFAEPAVLQRLCESVVVPNMHLREVDVELFEDNPIEYIRRDLEGSDTDTRRRAATELVKGLRRHLESAVTGVCAQYVTALLQDYGQHPTHWHAKDAAVFLVTALAVRGGTQAQGTTAVSELVPVGQFYEEHILPELSSPRPSSPLLHADSLRFVSTFRQYLPPPEYRRLLPLLPPLILSSSYVVQTYAGAALERLLSVKDQGKLRFGSEDLAPFLPTLFPPLCRVLQAGQVSENEYVLKALLRLITVAGPAFASLVGECLQLLVGVLARVYKNPTNPTFNHYLFESISALIKVAGKDAQAFEQRLFEPFQAILQADVQEFSPYVFQLLSMLLEANPAGQLPPQYVAILSSLLSPTLWERSGNIPALVRLLQAYLAKGGAQIVASNSLEPILGIFQKLIASKIHDHEGFYLLESIVEYLPLQDFARYMPTILTLLFTRIQKDKTLKFIKSFVVFFSLFIGKHGPTTVLDQVDAVQKDLFRNILASIYLPNVQKVSGNIERKMAAIALTKLVTECPRMIQPPYWELWEPSLKTLMGLLEGPEEESGVGEEEEIEVTEGEGYSAAYSHLLFAAKADVDPFPAVAPRPFLAEHLYRFTRENPGKFLSHIESALGPQGMALLQQYFTLVPHLPPPHLS